ncbi:hypothetical protein KR038_011748 [Drosophila bunnanda]|nr:hypothetical protein KR038_011748 [Drosophila bunnanda]
MSSSTISALRNSGNMSRYEVIAWVNHKLMDNIKKVEDLCTGVAYCRMMGLMSPSSINMKQVKMKPAGKNDYEDNLGLLQEAFNHLKIKQPVPIDLLIQGRFKHNFEFIKKFKEIYDAQTKLQVGSKVSQSVKPKTSRALAKVKDSAEPKSSLVQEADKKEEPNPDEKVQDVPDQDPMPIYTEIPEQPEMPVKLLPFPDKIKPLIKSKTQIIMSSFAEIKNKKKEDPEPEGKVQYVLDEDPRVMLMNAEMPEELGIPGELEMPVKLAGFSGTEKPAIKAKSILAETSNNMKEDPELEGRVQDILDEDPMIMMMNQEMQEPEIPEEPEMPVKFSVPEKPAIKAKSILAEISNNMKEDPELEGRVQDVLDEDPMMMMMRQEMQEPEIPESEAKALDDSPLFLAKITDKRGEADLNSHPEVQHFANEEPMMQQPEMQIVPEKIQDNEAIMIPSVKKGNGLCRDILQFKDAPGILHSPYQYYYSPGWKGRRWRSEGCLVATHLEGA